MGPDQEPANFYRDLYDIVHVMDFHDYDESHAFYAGLTPEQKERALHYRRVNKKKLGMFSDELSGKYLSEIVCLRSKVYSLRLSDDTEMKKCGGTRIHQSMTDFNFDLYRQVLHREKLVHYADQRLFHSNRHNMFLHHIKKKALCAYDEKRFIKPCGIETYAYGHCDIPNLVKNWPENKDSAADSDIELFADSEMDTSINSEMDLFADWFSVLAIEILIFCLS